MILLLIVVIVLLVLLAVFKLLGFLIAALIVGAVIGGLARLLLPGQQNIGYLATIAFGWVGSLVGGLIGRKVLHLHSNIVVVLLEIGIAVVLVAFASSAGNSIAKRDRTLRF